MLNAPTNDMPMIDRLQRWNQLSSSRGTDNSCTTEDGEDAYFHAEGSLKLPPACENFELLCLCPSMKMHAERARIVNSFAEEI